MPSRPGICATMNSRITRPIVPTTAAALLRVAVDSSTPMLATAQQRDQVDGVGSEHEQQRFGCRDDGSRERPHGVKAPRGDAGDGRHGGRHEHRDRGVGHRRQGLRGEHLAAVDRAREDRLERAVAVLVGDDVAGDQRGDEGQHEGGQEQQHQHGRGQAGLRDLRGEDVVPLRGRGAGARSGTTTKNSGRMTTSASPR